MFLVEQGDSPLGALLSSSPRGHLHFPSIILTENSAQPLKFRERADEHGLPEEALPDGRCADVVRLLAQMVLSGLEEKRV